MSGLCERYNCPKPDAAPFIEAAKTLRLEGNVRTLRNHLERAIIEELDASSMVDTAEIEGPIAADITPLLDLPWAELQDSVEQLYLRRLIARSGGNREQMAALAGVNRATIFRWFAKTPKSR